MIDIHHLRTFVGLAEVGRVTQAAERLHLGQLAAIAHVKALEDSLGVVVFERTPHGLVLNTSGQEVAHLARRVLGAAASLAASAREMRKTVSGKCCLRHANPC